MEPQALAQLHEEAHAIDVFNRVLSDIEECGVHPVALIQGGQVIDLVQVQNTGAQPGRPFMVFEVASPDPRHKTLIYKTRTEPDPRYSAPNEIHFLEQVAPQLQYRLPGDVAEKVAFPEVISSRVSAEGRYPYVLMEKLEGRIAGDIHDLDRTVLGARDFDLLAEVARTIATVPLETYLEWAPGLRLTEIPWGYAFQWEEKGAMVEELLGAAYLDKLSEELRSSHELLDSKPFRFAGGDINPSNVIKLQGGKLGLIDWERSSKDRNPAVDYAFLLYLLGDRPLHQRRFFRKVLALNLDIPDFRECLRLEYIFFRALGELWHWRRLSKEESNPSSKARRAQSVRWLKEALDGQGLWA